MVKLVFECSNLYINWDRFGVRFKMNKQEKEKLKERKKKQDEQEMWLKIIFIPLVVGISLVAAPISMVLFKVIGWVLMIFGIFAGLAYLFKLYGIHKEKIQKIKEEVLSGVGRKKK